MAEWLKAHAWKFCVQGGEGIIPQLWLALTDHFSRGSFLRPSAEEHQSGYVRSFFLGQSHNLVGRRCVSAAFRFGLLLLELQLVLVVLPVDHRLQYKWWYRGDLDNADDPIMFTMLDAILNRWSNTHSVDHVIVLIVWQVVADRNVESSEVGHIDQYLITHLQVG